MTKNQRRLTRAFYQGLTTQAEKDRFYAVMDQPKENKVKYIASMLGKAAIDAETVDAIMAASSLTKEDRIMIFSGMVRQWIFSFLGL